VEQQLLTREVGGALAPDLNIQDTHICSISQGGAVKAAVKRL